MSSSFRLVYWIGLWSYWAYALSPPSTSVSSDFMVLCECLKNSNYFTLPCRGLNWPGGIGHLPGGQTNYCPSVLDTVGWVMWPVKFVPDMTYNVFGGTLNPTLPTYLPSLIGYTCPRHLNQNLSLKYWKYYYYPSNEWSINNFHCVQKVKWSSQACARVYRRHVTSTCY